MAMEPTMVHRNTINLFRKKERYLIVFVSLNTIQAAGHTVERYTTQEMLPFMPPWIPRILQVMEMEIMMIY
jgi:hypothetical protein